MSRIVTKATEIFSFQELSPKAQDKAIENFSQLQAETWSGQDTIDEYKIKLQELGFEGVEIHYSGFYSQGDGASFTATRFDIRKAMKASSIASYYKSFYTIAKTQDIRGRVSRISSHYYHENTVKVIFPEYEGYNVQESDTADALTEYVRTLCKELYRLLESDYHYACGEESARAIFEMDDTEYTADGEEY